MRSHLPEFTTKAELFAHLRTNVKSLITQKKALPIVSDDLDFGYSARIPVKRAGTKAEGEEAEKVDGEYPVDVIANMAGWCDSYLDVMIKDSWKKSITDVSASGEKLFYHFKNHGDRYNGYRMDDIVGKDPSLYTKDIDLTEFNIQTDLKKAQALMMATTIMRSYDEKVYNLYVDKQVKQHSIGLQYINIVLCLDSTEEEDVVYKKNWDKYYPQVINKEKVDNYGYFWAVIEAKIIEVSTVCYGANILTPVYSSGQPSKADTDNQPSHDTGKEEEKQESDSIPIKGMMMCPSCYSVFEGGDSGSSQCPSCGQYTSPSSTSVEADLFASLSAEPETNFFNI
jgi:hypothetical protein